MDPSPHRAEEIVRHAIRASAAVGPRILTIVMATLEKERADHRRLLQAYWEQEYRLYLMSEEARQGGETGSTPPPPANAAKMLAPGPGSLPPPGMLCTDEHEPMIDDTGYCSACELLHALRTV